MDSGSGSGAGSLLFIRIWPDPQLTGLMDPDLDPLVRIADPDPKEIFTNPQHWYLFRIFNNQRQFFYEKENCNDLFSPILLFIILNKFTVKKGTVQRQFSRDSSPI
jgi:hypothetical protein